MLAAPQPLQRPGGCTPGSRGSLGPANPLTSQRAEDLEDKEISYHISFLEMHKLTQGMHSPAFQGWAPGHLAGPRDTDVGSRLPQPRPASVWTECDPVGVGRGGPEPGECKAHTVVPHTCRAKHHILV